MVVLFLGLCLTILLVAQWKASNNNNSNKQLGDAAKVSTFKKIPDDYKNVILYAYMQSYFEFIIIIIN
jgi:hypothetical protein